MRKLIVVVGGLLVSTAVPVTAAAWSGVVQVPIVSAMMGMDRAPDLGMEEDPVALEAFCRKYGITRPSPPQNYTFASTYHLSGAVHVDGVLSEAALGSLVELDNENPYVSGLNFRVHRGYIEIAGFVKNVPGYPFSGPAYGRFSISKTGPRSIAISILQLDFGRIPVPANILRGAQDKLNSNLNKKIAEAGFIVDTVDLREGAIYFRGTLPKTITADPPDTNPLP